MSLNLISPAIATPEPPAAGSYGPTARAWAERKLKLVADPWQSLCIDRLLAHDSDGNLIVSLALFSTGRQNGKTTIVRIVVGWILDEGHKLPAFASWVDMLCAAHDAGQARVVYRAVQRDMLKLHKPTYGSGKRNAARLRITDFFGIEIGGLTLDTATSQPGSARGITAGLIAWDEMLTQRNWQMWEALTPSQSAVPNPILLLTSTAGYADSVILRSLYDRAVKIQRGELEPDPSFLCLWWMADDDEAGLDWEQLRKANPALIGGRLNEAKLRSEFEIMPRASWIRERLNRWADERQEGPFSLAAWGACRLHEPLQPQDVASPRYVLAVNVNNTWTDATIAVAAKRKDGRVGVEIHQHFEGTTTRQIQGAEISASVSAFAEKYRVAKVLYLHNDPIAPEAMRHKAMTGRPWEATTSVEYLRFCNDFKEAVGSVRIAHDDPLLDGQVSYAGMRQVGSEDAWRWAVTNSGGPITAVQAATLAVGEVGKEAGALQLFTPKISPQDGPESQSGTMSHP